MNLRKISLHKRVGRILVLFLSLSTIFLSGSTFSNPSTKSIKNSSLFNNIELKEEEQKMKQEEEEQLPLTFNESNYSLGVRNLRFHSNSPEWNIELDADAPSTWRVASGYCLRYLYWINRYGENRVWRFEKIDYEKIEKTVEEIKKILNSDKLDDVYLLPLCNMVLILDLLNELDAIEDNTRIISAIQKWQIEDGGFLAYEATLVDPYSDL
ncbi:MAG: hypothetical protein EAX90_04200 [Candidatus Heimdallarchaeota archaeon]|nr:hypothetical protein [Candidatus Heimdallarchaeota archaeon]